MQNIKSKIGEFNQQIDDIVKILDVEENKQEIRENLLLTNYLKFINKLEINPESKELAEKLSSQGEIGDEEIESIYKKIEKELLEQKETVEVLTETMKETLEEYYSEIESNLSSEQAEKIKEIISKNL